MIDTKNNGKDTQKEKLAKEQDKLAKEEAKLREVEQKKIAAETAGDLAALEKAIKSLDVGRKKVADILEAVAKEELVAEALAAIAREADQDLKKSRDDARRKTTDVEKKQKDVEKKPNKAVEAEVRVADIINLKF